MNITEKLKSTTKQIQIICDYLIKECEHDEHLAERILLDNKTLDDMYKYIIASVKKNYKIVNQGVCVAPEDVYNMAIHYFIEDDETLKSEVPIILEANTVNKINADKVPVEKPKKVKIDEDQLSLFDLMEDEDEDEEYEDED